jgi:hypothetical protein
MSRPKGKQKVMSDEAKAVLAQCREKRKLAKDLRKQLQRINCHMDMRTVVCQMHVVMNTG